MPPLVEVHDGIILVCGPAVLKGQGRHPRQFWQEQQINGVQE